MGRKALRYHGGARGAFAHGRAVSGRLRPHGGSVQNNSRNAIFPLDTMALTCDALKVKRKEPALWQIVIDEIETRLNRPLEPDEAQQVWTWRRLWQLTPNEIVQRLIEGA